MHAAVVFTFPLPQCRSKSCRAGVGLYRAVLVCELPCSIRSASCLHKQICNCAFDLACGLRIQDTVHA